MQQQRIGERTGRELDAFTGGLDGGALRHALGQRLVKNVAELAAPQAAGQVAVDRHEQRVRHVAATGKRVQLVLLHPGAHGLHHVLPAQPRRQPVAESDAAPHQPFLNRVGRAGRQQHRAFAGQAARLHDQVAPLLAGFPPAVIADVVAKAHEDRQGQAEQREGHRRQVRGREP
ncbi:hypothetical protein D3C73_1086430 [compost metagenome]